MISQTGHPAVTLIGFLYTAALCFRVRCRGSTVSQRRYLQGYRIMGFLTSANFELKLVVRDLMCSINSGAPRSSRFCLPLMY